MKKMIKAKPFLIVLLVVTIGGVYLAYQTYRKHELTQFVMWSPRVKMVDYEFIHDNKAVAIRWDNEAELKEAEEAKKHDSRINIENMTRVNGERYIVQQSYKLKSAPYKYWTLEENAVPFLNSNTPERGEYWLLDVYDTKGGKIKQRTYDVFKMVREYNKDYIPRMIPDYTQLLRTEQGKTYLPINMVVSRKPEFKSESALIDIEVGKIVESTPSGQTAKDFYDREKRTYKPNFEGVMNQNDKLSNQKFGFVFSIFGFKEPVQKDQYPSLASEYPKIFDILNGGLFSELYFLGKEDVSLKISFLKLLLPEGTNIFKDITIPATSSKDGQEHVVQTEEEFLQYYQANPEDE